MNDDNQDDSVYDIDSAHKAVYGHEPGSHEEVDTAREVREAEKSRRGGKRKLTDESQEEEHKD
ncbi:hypothetical protein A3D84_01195 [Candidatus Woesebacteria bacterium RIFCSPHIGHO2_02_FULL_42_20]|uniref:Uncharacterized protein n=1 Tax=Candidatus Woesebacteria bacterium RIFCSPHIGHO2_12_FULL_41_24 TaxID=1802510 RepID=A0A1F8AQ90_9BACT|nr:MAG: hypothetical protein A2W15_05420 [Candidatus Woesebacteria bacterium RBG_16_41_13]OGM30731.1 MAG: hypothetical protein A2873_01315 [Candidatus Woesebacteria bacterium RIFCSPHIGHO2_01_FULL_42_80]OGM35868.1 MAG: hypothetical protein A3D84_01195 [Candidatus Woesebacteria bacterium RIFCSPHIGHO2_02_FULL_42_20]OGM53926.1 MAG: hypothetical protein A3E44_05960 [Candidatus Woesebacteria bacterium RIFCSPHIGHO2_12_FULL_41_24]OGM66118.1 MAG: hypothetical protein A2969_04055 [Candidatus Woesebacteri